MGCSRSALDVYKRQGHIERAELEDDLFIRLFADADSVSYTHLDVYKRQVLDRLVQKEIQAAEQNDEIQYMQQNLLPINCLLYTSSCV